MEQLRPSLVHDIHLLSHDEQLSAIDTMADAISKIKRYMNTRVSVQRLPLELLTLVFEYASFGDRRYALRSVVRDSEEDSEPSEQAYGTLISITHVCHAWRSAALNTPHLWGCVDNHHGERLDTFVCRSRAAPLSLMFHGVFGANLGLEQFLEDNGSRLQRLDVLSCGSKLILPYLKVDGSRLECVTVAAKRTCWKLRVDPRAASFEQSISTLKGLALCLGEAYWVPSTHFPNLTHLLLCGCFGALTDSNRPILEPLTALLIGTPRLQYLHLVDLPEALPSSTLQPVSLPHLKLFLCMFCDPDTSLELLSWLKLPAEVFVALDSLFCYSDDYEPVDTSNALARYQLLEGEWITSLTHLEITISRETQWVVAEGYRSGLWLKSDESFRFCRLQPMFPFESVQALDFFTEHNSQPTEHTRQQLQDVLDLTPSLVSLRFPAFSTKAASAPMRGTSRRALDDKLLLPLMPGEGDIPTRCPLLAALCIEAPLEELKELAPHIADVLAARARAGVPLQSLTLRVPPRIYATNPPSEDLVLVRERLLREVFNAAACYVEVLNIELYVDGPGELATRGTHWDVELSVEAEKYWITPDGMSPRWFNSSIEGDL